MGTFIITEIMIGTSRDYFCPPPLIFEKRNGQYIYYILCINTHIGKLFVEYAAFLTKIWPKNIDFCRKLQLNVGDFRGHICSIYLCVDMINN